MVISKVAWKIYFGPSTFPFYFLIDTLSIPLVLEIQFLSKILFYFIFNFLIWERGEKK
jgi:hypothetical protein